MITAREHVHAKKLSSCRFGEKMSVERHSQDCDRITAAIEERDRDGIAMLARLIEEKGELEKALRQCHKISSEREAENLELRAMIDPDGPRRALGQVQPMQAFTGEAAPMSAQAVLVVGNDKAAYVIAELQAEVKLLEAQKAALTEELARVKTMGEARMPHVAVGGWVPCRVCDGAQRNPRNTAFCAACRGTGVERA